MLSSEAADIGLEGTPSDYEKNKIILLISFLCKDISEHTNTGLFSHFSTEQSMQFLNSLILNFQRQKKILTK